MGAPPIALFPGFDAHVHIVHTFGCGHWPAWPYVSPTQDLKPKNVSPTFLLQSLATDPLLDQIAAAFLRPHKCLQLLLFELFNPNKILKILGSCYRTAQRGHARATGWECHQGAGVSLFKTGKTDTRMC